MTFKRLMSLGTFVGCVLFSYGIVSAQSQTTPATTTAQPTIKSTNPRVVVTDNLTQANTTPAQTATQPKTTTKKIGNYSVNVTDNVTAQAQSTENGKFYNVTSWDGTKWVTTRKFMPNSTAAPAKPNP